MSQTGVMLIGAVVVVFVAIRFDLYCLRDLAAADVVLYLPPEVWFYAIIFSTPLGGMTYLALGRPR